MRTLMLRRRQMGQQIKVQPGDVRGAASTISGSVHGLKLGSVSKDGSSTVKGNGRAHEVISEARSTLNKVQASLEHYASMLNSYASAIEEEDQRESQGW